ncbi:hypothetical protein QVD99_000808 [Batrachochytrium dendrobatidis]|nr:hypothetical protein QVD99_000808 [Batrachochytrium dendrobatidis]
MLGGTAFTDNTSHLDSNNLFVQAVTDSGLVRNIDNIWTFGHVLSTTQESVSITPYLFSDRLSKKIKSYSTIHLDQFLNGFATLMDTTDSLIGILSSVKQVKNGSDSLASNDTAIGSMQQNTLARMLLNIHSLQPSISQLLLEKLAEFSSQDIIMSGKNIPKMLIKQLSWLDYIVKPSEMIEKIIEILPVLVYDVQTDLISSLPEIAVDSEHQRISLYLIELMAQKLELTQTILDTLISFSMDDTTLIAARDACLDKLDSADLDTLPIIVRFLLNIATVDSAQTVINQIRANLNMDQIAQDLKKETLDIEQGRSKGKKPDRSPQALILESIRTSFQTRPFLQDSWIRVIFNVDFVKNMLRSLDFLVMIIIYSLSTSHRKRAQLLLKKKALSGDLTPSIVRKTISGHGSSISSYFSSILGLGDYMMSTGLECCHDICIELFIATFQTSDISARQHVIGLLATHIGTGIEFNIGISLSVLLELTSIEPQNVAPFSIFIKSILDHLDKLSVSNVRRFFEVLSNLAVVSDNELFDTSASSMVIMAESSILTDLHIVIRKYLGSANCTYKQIGVLGSAVLIQKLAEKNSMTPHTLSQAQKIFETTITSCRQSMSCLGTVFDEIAFLVSQNKLHIDFISWLRELINDSFLDIFVLDDEEMKLCADKIETLNSDFPRLVVKSTLWMELENCEGGLNIYPLALRLIRGLPDDLKDTRPLAGILDFSNEKNLIALLCSQFKLWQTCETATTGINGSFVNAMLVSGLLMFEQKESMTLNVEYDQTARHALCTTLFQALNLFRELLNCFGFVSEKATMRFCLLRVRHIMVLEKYLVSILASLPGWIPPNLLEENIDSGFNSQSLPETVFVSSATISLMKETSMTLTQNGSQVTTKNRKSARNGRTSKLLSSSAKRFDIPLIWELKDLRPLMRELELGVFSILAFCEDMGEAKLDFNELEFLLSDLLVKVEFQFGPKGLSSLRQSSQTRASVELLTRISVRNVFSKLVLILPGICKTLESTGKEICNMIADEDSTFGVVDQSMLNCFDLIIKCLAILLKWPGFTDPALHDDRMNFLQVLASRTLIQENPNLQATQDQLVVGAFDYIVRFEKCLVTGEAASGLGHLLAALYNLVPHSDIVLGKLRYLSNVFVNQYWKDKSSMKPETLVYLIQQQINMAADPLAITEEYFAKAFKAISEGDEEVLVDFPLLTRVTFISFFKAAFTGLCQQVAQFSGRGQTQYSESEVTISRFSTCFSLAITLVRKFEQPPFISVILKKSRVFLLAYIKRVLPVLTREFKTYKEEIIQILRMVQTGTRILQSVCSETKVSKDTNLAASVPPLRKVMELFLYEIKKLLADNNSLQAFSIGNLKHRDISGGLISSQIPTLVEPDDDSTDQQELDDIEDERMSDLDVQLETEQATPLNKAAKTTQRSKDAEISKSSKPKNSRAVSQKKKQQPVSTSDKRHSTETGSKKRRLAKRSMPDVAAEHTATEEEYDEEPREKEQDPLQTRKLSEDIVADYSSDKNSESNTSTKCRKSNGGQRSNRRVEQTVLGRNESMNLFEPCEGLDTEALQLESAVSNDEETSPELNSLISAAPVPAYTSTIAPQQIRRIGLARRRLVGGTIPSTTGASTTLSSSFKTNPLPNLPMTDSLSQPRTKTVVNTEGFGQGVLAQPPEQLRAKRLGVSRRPGIKPFDQPIILSQSLSKKLPSPSFSQDQALLDNDDDNMSNGISSQLLNNIDMSQSELDDEEDDTMYLGNTESINADSASHKRKKGFSKTVTTSSKSAGSYRTFKRKSVIVESETDESMIENSEDTDLDGFIVNDESSGEEMGLEMDDDVDDGPYI